MERELNHLAAGPLTPTLSHKGRGVDVGRRAGPERVARPDQIPRGRAGPSAGGSKILLALWLYATLEAVGGARELARLCEAHVAYRWLCGGVSTNHHTRADSRVGQVALRDRLLAQGVASLASEGLVKLERLAQDGVRIRASAGSSSYRRRERLESLLSEA